ncbi:hypothetical protein NDU88_006665 [Pleurodeles waltl]|uniref:Uncharacterized protein n=1 Tax=Pleurodeles waltl TaxID=8319 RepID=A0AAV7MGE5_PLEWA|nr:hypothetical protein NDU88_006665 [Pleurodeles waltl]
MSELHPSDLWTMAVTKEEARASDATVTLFRKSKKGDKILHHVKDFMKCYVYPSEQMNSKEEVEHHRVFSAVLNLEPF